MRQDSCRSLSGAAMLRRVARGDFNAVFGAVSSVAVSIWSKVWKVFVEMGAFNARTVKPSMLWGNIPTLKDIYVRMAPETRKRLREERSAPGSAPPTRQYKDAKGKRRFTGSKTLKETQPCS